MKEIYVISSYKHHGMWVFDDPYVGLLQEPFVAGADTWIDRVAQCNWATMSALPPKADMVQHDRDVRFVPKADKVHCSKSTLFDNLVRNTHQSRRHCQAKQLGGLEIYD